MMADFGITVIAEQTTQPMWPPLWKLPGEVARGVAPGPLPFPVDGTTYWDCHSQNPDHLNGFALLCTEEGFTMLCRARYRERTECEKLGHLVKRGFAQVPEILGCLEYTHFAIRGECSRCGEFISVGEMLPVDVAVQLGCRVEATW